MDDVSLPPDLDRFAEEAVAAGRYRDKAELVRAGIELIRKLESERAAFIRSLEEAEAEGERDGFVSMDDVHAEMMGIVEELRRAHK